MCYGSESFMIYNVVSGFSEIILTRVNIVLVRR